MNYYLIPFDTSENAKKMKLEVVPKYKIDNLLGAASGLISKRVGKGFLRNYYVVLLGKDADAGKLEVKEDVLKLDKDTSVVALADLGVNTLSIVPGYESRDKAVTKWLIDEEKILSEVLKETTLSEVLKSGN